jgi:hypothetical protein
MLDVMEADWEERLRLDTEAHEQGGRDTGKECEYTHLKDSILVGYVNALLKERKNARTQILRALFADGSQADLAVYKEVFERETSTQSKNKRKRAETLDMDHALDLENGQFGDYIGGVEDNLSSEDSDLPKPEPGRGGRRGRQKKAADPVTSDGMLGSVFIRLRLFSLLSAVCFYLPDPFTTIPDLFDKFAVSVRGLPLSLFHRFVSSHKTPLRDEVYVSLLRRIIDKLLPTYDDPGDVDPETDEGDGISVAILEQCFLPHAANKMFFEDNAKLSLVLEAMLRFVWLQSGISYSPSLRNALERGIEARIGKATQRKNMRAKNEPVEIYAKEVLGDSTKRLQQLIDDIEEEGKEAARILK